MTTLPASPAEIAALIPHQGRMNLLDAVLACSPQAITCRARGHGRADHPLRLDGLLPAPVGIEYAAQAMALHGALNAHAADFVEQTPAHLFPKTAFQRSSSRGDFFQHIFDANGPGRILANEARRGGDGFVFYHKHVGRVARDDAFGLDQVRLGRDAPALHQLCKDSARFITN